MLALAVCAWYAGRSYKAIGKSVSRFIIGLVPPIIGNMIVISSGSETLATIGYYIFFLGMDYVIFALFRFTLDYCELSQSVIWQRIERVLIALFCIDIASYIVNIFTGHCFRTAAIMVDDRVYYTFVAGWGQTYHRMVGYGFMLAVLTIFVVLSIRTPRLYAEKYYIILFALVVGTLWQTYYIVSHNPVDRSMIGFGAVGLMVYFFSIHYRPLRVLDKMLAGIAQGLTDALFFFDASGHCIWINKAAGTLISVDDTAKDLPDGKIREFFGKSVSGPGEWSGKIKKEINDKTYYYDCDKHNVADDKGRNVGSFINVRDITEEQEELMKEQYTARHDAATGLYTRDYLIELISRKIKDDKQARYSIVYVDICDYSILNGIFGDDFGNSILRETANFLKDKFSDECLSGRLIGDTFGICIPEDQFDPGLMEAELSDFSIMIDGVEHNILIHLGVYETGNEDIDVADMFERARMALGKIRDDYSAHVAYYDEKMMDEVLWNQQISAQLKGAIERRELKPYLQPIADKEGKIIGAEALARWESPENGFLPPATFLPVFEKNGMIADVDICIWRSVCEILASWKRRDIDKFISINISPMDFHFMDVAYEVKNIAEEYDIDPRQLRVEITETFLMTDVEKRVKMINDLKSAGFIVEMDDFGSGYSSFNMLKELPVDVIKIDMVFLRNVKDDRRAKTILHNIINMAFDLGIVSLTEGVETDEQLKMLTDMGCDMFQGYYFSRPIPVRDFERLYL